MKSLLLYSQNSVISTFDFDNAICKPLLYSKTSNIDIEFDRIINLFLSDDEYLSIIIPLCFGDVLSDYLGLRLALHIRTTKTKNQHKYIYIYGFERLDNLIDSEFFLILNTKGVTMVDYNLLDLKKVTLIESSTLEKMELINELSKLNLKIPTNYFDDHSIANLWGAFRLIEIAAINISLINTLDPDDLKNIYFKWLVTKNLRLPSINENFKETNREYKENFKVLKDKLKNAPIIDLSKFRKK